MDEKTKYRNELKELFKNYGLHRAIRSDSLNNLVDEINTYYKERETPVDEVVKQLVESHEEHLKEQLDGWVKYLTTVRNNMPNNTDRALGAVEGFDKAIQILKDVGER